MSSCSLIRLNNRNWIKQIRSKYFTVTVFLGPQLSTTNLRFIIQNLWWSVSGMDAAETSKWNLLVNAVSFVLNTKFKLFEAVLINKHIFFSEDILEWLVGDRRQLFLLILCHKSKTGSKSKLLTYFTETQWSLKHKTRCKHLWTHSSWSLKLWPVFNGRGLLAASVMQEDKSLLESA